MWPTRCRGSLYEGSSHWIPDSPVHAFRGKPLICVIGQLLRCCFERSYCFKFQGTPASARHIPLLFLFSPLFLLQGAGVLFAASKLVEKIILLLRSGAGGGIYFRFSSRAHDCLGFLHHGSR